MTDQVDERLGRLLGGDHLAALRKRLRESFQRAPRDATVDTIRVTGLAAEEHAALASLVGRPQRPTRSMQVNIRDVDAILQRAGIASGLHDALEKLDGPIIRRADVRLEQDAAWSSVVSHCRRPDLIGLLASPNGLGLLKRLARQDASVAQVLCARTEAVLARLPADGITRSQLAATILGDAHGLDTGRAIATLVLTVLRTPSAETEQDDGDETRARVDDDLDRPGSIDRPRDIWARSGVLVNELARPALVLNLPANRASQFWRRGEPAYLSLRTLLRSPPQWQVTDRMIYVCENPNLLAIAADYLGPRCAPLVCTDGMPAAAQRCLLSQLADAGARLHYHGDFDWPGINIANVVLREQRAVPWRLSASDYLAATQTAPDKGPLLRGTPVKASWDEVLTLAMQDKGIAIAEEAIAMSLLLDLDDGNG